MYYKCHKVNFRHSDSYKDFADLIKRKEATENPKNEADKPYS